MNRKLAGVLCAIALHCASRPTEIVLRIFSEAAFSTGPTDRSGVTNLQVLLFHPNGQRPFQSLDFGAQRMTFPGEIAVIRADPSSPVGLEVRATETFGNMTPPRSISLRYSLSFTHDVITALDIVFANRCMDSSLQVCAEGTNCGWAEACTPQSLPRLPELSAAVAGGSPCGLLCDGLCADLQSSRSHCGRCGNGCPEGYSCLAGACICPPGDIVCDGACRSRRSGAHCGGCEVSCPVACRGEECSTARTLALGASHGCSRLSHGGVACWGDNRHGQTGAQASSEVASDIPMPNEPTPAMVSGGAHTCVLSALGRARCWGDNRHGQLGRALMPGAPRLLSTPRPDFVSTESLYAHLAAGRDFTCATEGLLVGGTEGRAFSEGARAWCWGHGELGQIGGLGAITDQLSPMEVPLTFETLSEIVAGSAHACVRTASGAVWCWGDNRQGQCGRPMVLHTAPSLVMSGENPLRATALAAGGDHTCAISEGRILCWGSNHSGELGDPRLGARPTPLGPRSPDLVDIRRITAGAAHTCAITGARGETPRVYCWGSKQRRTTRAPWGA